MKVLDLCCTNQHLFEGWFASDDEFSAQLARGLVECPICGDRGISRRPSAPRLNLSGAQEPAQEVALDAADPVARQAAWLRAMRELLARTEDVGDRFADEARSMHRGDIPDRPIRGRTTPEETRALLEEGVPVLPLHIPRAFKGTLQ